MRRISWVKVAAALMLVALALVPLDSYLHGHDEGTHGDDHCAVCHVRHLSFVETTAALSRLAPALLERATLTEAWSTDLDAALSLHPSRGPPA